MAYKSNEYDAYSLCDFTVDALSRSCSSTHEAFQASCPRAGPALPSSATVQKRPVPSARAARRAYGPRHSSL
jgi:hypothetical protein